MRIELINPGILVCWTDHNNMTSLFKQYKLVQPSPLKRQITKHLACVPLNLMGRLDAFFGLNILFYECIFGLNILFYKCTFKTMSATSKYGTFQFLKLQRSYKYSLVMQKIVCSCRLIKLSTTISKQGCSPLKIVKLS